MLNACAFGAWTDLGRDDARTPLKAILGPTNTGKTHLAVERMCGHSSGMIGFPLRLLAREVYDRVVQAEGREPGRPDHRRGEDPAEGRALVPVHRRKHADGARFRLRRARRGAAGRGSRARPRLHRPDASRARPRGDDDPRLGEPRSRWSGRFCPRRRSSPGRASRPCPMPAPPSSRGCRRARRSSPSRPSRSMRSPRCCAGCAAARRW